ncbi:MAG: hypothetical protein ACYS8L_11355 [Planctomycetota bacterium]
MTNGTPSSSAIIFAPLAAARHAEATDAVELLNDILELFERHLQRPAVDPDVARVEDFPEVRHHHQVGAYGTDVQSHVTRHDCPLPLRDLNFSCLCS